jgi:hypothetical protein
MDKGRVRVRVLPDILSEYGIVTGSRMSLPLTERCVLSMKNINPQRRSRDGFFPYGTETHH